MTTPPPSDPPTQPEIDDRGRATLPADTLPHAGRHDGLGTAALVLGIVGVVLAVSVLGGFVLGVVALVFGILTLRRAHRGEAPRGHAVAGTILGAIAVVLSVATMVVALVVGIGPLASTTRAATAAPARAQRQQCVQQAHGDRSAIEACRREFGQPRRPGTAT